MKQRDTLATTMIVILTVVGLVNFFAPFFLNYKTDPLITYIFMGTASVTAGYKGVAAVIAQRLGINHKKENSE